MCATESVAQRSAEPRPETDNPKVSTFPLSDFNIWRNLRHMRAQDRTQLDLVCKKVSKDGRTTSLRFRHSVAQLVLSYSTKSEYELLECEQANKSVCNS